MHATDALEVALDAFVACEGALTKAEETAEDCLANATWRSIDPNADLYINNMSLLEIHNRMAFGQEMVCLDTFYEIFLCLRSKLLLHMNQASTLIQASDHTIHGVHYKKCLEIYGEVERMLEVVTRNSYAFRVLDEAEEYGGETTELDILAFLDETCKGLEQVKAGLSVELPYKATEQDMDETFDRAKAIEMSYFSKDNALLVQRVRSPMELYKSTRHEMQQLSSNTVCGARLRMLEDRALTVKAVRILGPDKAEKFLAQEIRNESDSLKSQEELLNIAAPVAKGGNASNNVTGRPFNRRRGGGRGSSAYSSVPPFPDELPQYEDQIKSPAQANKELKKRQTAVEQAIANLELCKTSLKPGDTGVSLKEVWRRNPKLKSKNIIPAPKTVEKGRDEIKAAKAVLSNGIATLSAAFKDDKGVTAGESSKKVEKNNDQENGAGQDKKQANGNSKEVAKNGGRENTQANGDSKNWLRKNGGQEHGNVVKEVIKDDNQDNETDQNKKQANGQADEHETKTNEKTCNGKSNGADKSSTHGTTPKEEGNRLLKMIDSKIVQVAIRLGGINEEVEHRTAADDIAQEEFAIDAARDKTYNLLTQLSNLAEIRKKAEGNS